MNRHAQKQLVTTNRPVQLPLGVQLPDTANFQAFQAQANVELLNAARNAAAGNDIQLYLHGGRDVGKSHILQAACRQAAENGCRTAYLPLAELAEYGVAMLDGLADMDLVCLDDIAAVAGERDWEETLVGLIDARHANHKALITACHVPPTELSFELADLRSRLGWGLVYGVHEADDDDKHRLLVQRASQRGLTLSNSVAAYLMRHFGRDVPGLLETLDQLDRASLIAKRRLTIPFIKQVLE